MVTLYKLGFLLGCNIERSKIQAVLVVFKLWYVHIYYIDAHFKRSFHVCLHYAFKLCVFLV